MELVIHNAPINVSVEHLSPDQIRVHVCVGTNTDDFVTAIENLSEDFKSSALALWNDPTVSRNYRIADDLVIVTRN